MDVVNVKRDGYLKSQELVLGKGHTGNGEKDILETGRRYGYRLVLV